MSRRRGHRIRRALRAVGLSILIFIAIFLTWRWWTRREPMAEREIYRGVYYQCLRLPETSQSGGLAHIVRVDLAAPGIGIWITPMDSIAVAKGWEYSTQRVGRTVEAGQLAVAVNGTLFSDSSPYIPLAGNWARSTQTIVVEHTMNHLYQPREVAVMWFEDDLTPHLENYHPPIRPDVIPRARWAIGGDSVVLWDGKADPDVGAADARTMLAIAPERRMLWLAVFEKASYRFAAEKLAGLGATQAIMLDGGTSSTMALGDKALGVRPGLLMAGWRPVADQFGIKAEPLTANAVEHSR